MRVKCTPFLLKAIYWIVILATIAPLLYGKQIPGKDDSTSFFTNPNDLSAYYLRQSQQLEQRSDNDLIRLWYADSAIFLAKKLRNKSLMARGHFIRGKILNEMEPIYNDVFHGKISPITDLNIAFDLAKEINDHILTSDIYASLSTYYYWTEDYDIAASYAQQHINFLEQHGLIDDTPYAVLAFVYGDQLDYDQAIVYFNKRINALKSSGKEKALASAMSDMGNMFYAAKNYDSARYYYLKGLEISNEYDEQKSISFLKDNIGLTYQVSGHYKEAIKWFLEALEHRRNEQWVVGEIVTMNHLGETYIKMGLPLSAIIILKECFPLAKKYNELEHLENNTHLLSIAYHQTQQPDSAYHYLDLSYHYQEDLWSQEKSRAIRASLRGVELENEKLKSELLRSDYFELLLISFIAFLVLSITLLYFYFKNRKNEWERGLAESERNAEIAKRELEAIENTLKLNEMKLQEASLKQNIDSLNREMVSYSHTIAGKNETFNQICQFLQDLATDNNMILGKREIDKLNQLIKSKIDDESDWNIFFDNFNLVHPEFFSSLKNNHPQLTVHDIRHCAYLYMNLSSAEIAKIMNISMDSLRNARVRLRKRLGLEASIGLEEYLRSHVSENIEI